MWHIIVLFCVVHKEVQKTIDEAVCVVVEEQKNKDFAKSATL